MFPTYILTFGVFGKLETMSSLTVTLADLLKYMQQPMRLLREPIWKIQHPLKINACHNRIITYRPLLLIPWCRTLLFLREMSSSVMLHGARQQKKTGIGVIIQMQANQHCQQVHISAMAPPASSPLQAEAYAIAHPGPSVLYRLFGPCFSGNNYKYFFSFKHLGCKAFDSTDPGMPLLQIQQDLSHPQKHECESKSPSKTSYEDSVHIFSFTLLNFRNRTVGGRPPGRGEIREKLLSRS